MTTQTVRESGVCGRYITAVTVSNEFRFSGSRHCWRIEWGVNSPPGMDRDDMSPDEIRQTNTVRNRALTAAGAPAELLQVGQETLDQRIPALFEFWYADAYAGA